MSLYLILNIASFIIPFLFSFEKRMQYHKRWKSLFPALLVTATFFIIWDIIFTKIGVWHFNPKYHTGIEFFGLPLEEWLFFICIPYASLFIHFAFRYFFPTVKLSLFVVKIGSIFLLALLLPVIATHWDKWYTAVNYSVLVLLLAYTLLEAPEILQTFFISFLIILIPFGIVNGILTGSFIAEPVVFYNNNENLGIRVGTIPIEDIGYAFTMLLMTLVLMKNPFKNESI